MDGEAARPVIVTGAGGSEDSRERKRCGGRPRQARLTGAEVHAVIAWQVPVTIFLVPSYTEADYRHDAADILDEAVAEAPDPGVPIIMQTVQGRAPAALVEEAEHAYWPLRRAQFQFYAHAEKRDAAGRVR